MGTFIDRDIAASELASRDHLLILLEQAIQALGYTAFEAAQIVDALAGKEALAGKSERLLN